MNNIEFDSDSIDIHFFNNFIFCLMKFTIVLD